MFSRYFIEGLLIYATIFALVGYSLTRECPTPGKKIALWLIFLILSFPGFFFWMLIWSIIIGALADSPMSH